MEKTEKEKTFKIIVVSLIFLGCFYQISHRFNGIWLFTTYFSWTSYLFIAFVLKNQNSHLPTQLHCASNLLLKLQIFTCLFLQLSSNSLPTSTNVPLYFPHFFRFMRKSLCVLGARKRTKVYCSCDIIQIYVNGMPYLLKNQHVVNFSELDESLS